MTIIRGTYSSLGTMTCGIGGGVSPSNALTHAVIDFDIDDRLYPP